MNSGNPSVDTFEIYPFERGVRKIRKATMGTPRPIFAGSYGEGYRWLIDRDGLDPVTADTQILPGRPMIRVRVPGRDAFRPIVVNPSSPLSRLGRLSRWTFGEFYIPSWKMVDYYLTGRESFVVPRWTGPVIKYRNCSLYDTLVTFELKCPLLAKKQMESFREYVLGRRRQLLERIQEPALLREEKKMLLRLIKNNLREGRMGTDEVEKRKNVKRLQQQMEAIYEKHFTVRTLRKWTKELKEAGYLSRGLAGQSKLNF